MNWASDRLRRTNSGSQTALRSRAAKAARYFRYGDRVGTAVVIFGEEGDHVLLGTFTLEALGLGLDPLRRELLPLPMILALTAPDRPQR
jgi:hypothetical protein